MIDLVNVTKTYETGTHALNGIDMHIDDGEFVFLVGPSGSGKSTIIKLLTAELKPTSGSVLVNGYQLESIKRASIPYMRRTLGVIFQDFRLIENKTVYENVAFAMRVIGAAPKEIKKRVPYVLELVGLENKGPCAGIGDTLSQVVLLPVLSVIFINLATQGAVWAPIAYTVLFMAIFYGVGYWMLNIGYKSGGEAVLKLMESGIFDKVVKVANILGCAVCGALICSYVSFNWNVVMMREGVEVFNLQTGVFDAILPNMMPLLLTMGVYGLSKKGVKSSYITFGTMLLGFVLGLLGVIA